MAPHRLIGSGAIRCGLIGVGVSLLENCVTEYGL